MRKIYTILLAFIFIGCGSSKKVKKEQELRLQKLENISEKITETLSVQTKLITQSKLKDISITPIDTRKPSTFIHNSDTLTVNNANVQLREENTTSKAETKQKKKNEKESNRSLESDLEIVSVEKAKENKGLKLGFWGWFWLFVLVLIIIAYFYLRKKLPFLP